jgi:predicted enzyme related to lactoylglutathione lyase
MPRVIHFEIHADNPERAVKFYQDVFGWEFTRWPGPMPYWLVKTGPDGEPGINGGLVPRQGPINGNSVIAYVCTIQISSVDEYVAKALAHGGTSVLPKMPIPGVGWLGYCKDTEGNIFGLMHPDPKAA